MLAENFFDVAVIGSGPSGSVAANKLSSSGLRVILFEKAKLPRYKTCGGGVVYRAVKYLPIDISSIAVRQFNLIEINDPQARFHYNLKRSFPVVYMTMRKDFDFALLEKARFAGTKVIDNCEVYDMTKENEIMILRTMKGEYKASFVIGADGAQGISVKNSGIKIKKWNMPAVEYEIFVSQEDMQRFSRIRFDFGFIPEGYAWLFP
jgi:flavin-dependent dehydrogenase